MSKTREETEKSDNIKSNKKIKLLKFESTDELFTRKVNVELLKQKLGIEQVQVKVCGTYPMVLFHTARTHYVCIS